MIHKSDLSILVLDFNKPRELATCLASIKEYVVVPHHVTVLVNGKTNEVITNGLDKGFIDRLIINRSNSGCGFGTITLFKSCETDYCISMQNDTMFIRPFTRDDYNACLHYLNYQAYSCIDLAGNEGQGKYSERGILWPTNRIKEIAEKLPGGGPGPYDHLQWNEEALQGIVASNFKSVGPFIGNQGMTTVRENKDGSIWEQKTDTKELRLISGTPKEISKFPSFNAVEWKKVLTSGTWPEWQIPESQKKESFIYWNHN